MRGILPRWRWGTLDGLWMLPLALSLYNFITRTWWDGKQTICGLSMACCSVVPVTVAEFHWMTLGAPAGPVLLCFCRKLAPSDSLHQYSGMLCPVLLTSSPLGVFPQVHPPHPAAEVSQVYLVPGSICS